ncbi:MAG: Rne/Rng family ribonuclease [Proteobacteria bacterium]|nr:Rne/Rng family ribonuclease [Pseudomonadota bacterium]
MPKRMLIDASHPEETRVVVLDGNKVEEFDFEAASKRPLKGNIYLAKVTRVEPSLQAAFVEYGGNRQGFLAFSEIHPDYYQIPMADRQALIAEQEAEARRRQEDDIESFEISSGPKPSSESEDEEEEASGDEAVSDTIDAAPDAGAAEALPTEDGAEHESPALAEAPAAEEDEDDHEEVFVHHGAAADDDHHAHHDDHVHHGHEDEEVDDIADAEEEAGVVDEQTVAAAASHIPADENVHIDTPEPEITENIPDIQTASEQPLEGAPAEGAEDEAAHGDSQALQAARPSQRWVRRRHYKIQEVIKRRQIILVQVVKEERGNKGAALTTYLSLAGRYCVLMPNTPRGGGISRKITNAGDRKRLKEAAQALELPEGMGLIIRTAGENRTKLEIKRDYEYLLRMWDTIRETTLNSIAPACVYEEGDIVKRAIRDLYNKDVSEIQVEGEAGYRTAKDFMRMLMPTHAKNVKSYAEPVPLYQRYHIEAQLDAMFSPTVTLKSGGYIVINQTEALVAIDVNSGRATREHSIEETARKTNLEAAEEIGRQLRLRDLAGLIVIDFIDMEDGRNDRDVEKRLRDAVKNDRARIQIGKISQFGLLEMSRQRLRAGVLAGSTVPCPHCGGQGIVRSVESTALRVMRGIEEEAQKQRAEGLTVKVAGDVAMYTLNQKRRELSRIESDYQITVGFEPNDELMAGDFEIERIGHRNPDDFPRPSAQPQPAVEEEDLDVVEEEELEAEDEAIAETETAPEDAEVQSDEPRGERDNNRRRRRRGGRNRNRGRGPRESQTEVRAEGEEASPPADGEDATQDVVEGGEGLVADAPEGGADGEGRRRRRRRRGRRGGTRDRAPNGEGGEIATVVPEPQTSRFGEPDEIDTTPREDAQAIVPNTASTPSWSLGDAEEIDTTPKDEPRVAEPVSADPSGPPKKGWWQRAFRS